MKWLAAIILTGYTLAAHAGPADFAHGRVIVVGEELVQRARLPQDVYEWVVRDDLGDLRVFNREAEQVPYALRRPATTSAHSDWQDLPIFTLPVASTVSTAGTEVNIELLQFEILSRYVIEFDTIGVNLFAAGFQRSKRCGTCQRSPLA